MLLRNRLVSALSSFASGGNRPRRTARPGRPVHLHLCVERLEPREVPAFFFVTSPLDSGPGTLRQALTDANNFMLNPDNWADITVEVPSILVTSPLPEQFISAIVLHKDPANPGGQIEGEVDIAVSPNPFNGPVFPGSVFKVSAIGDSFQMSDMHLFVQSMMAVVFTADGGAIHTEADLGLLHCTFGTPFTQNSGFHSMGNGGAVWAAGASVNVLDTDFWFNMADNLGGAIYNTAGDTNSFLDLEVHGIDWATNPCIFESNIATNGGGAINAVGPGILHVTNTDFYLNATFGRGGAIRTDVVSNVTVEYVTFAGNMAPNSADTGAMLIWFPEYTLLHDIVLGTPPNFIGNDLIHLYTYYPYIIYNIFGPPVIIN